MMSLVAVYVVIRLRIYQRQAASAKESLQRICGAWLSALECFQSKVPEEFYAAEVMQLEKSFLQLEIGIL